MNLDIKYFWSIFWRRSPYFFVLLFFGSSIGLTLATVLPPVYRANAQLLFEAQQISDDLVQTTVNTTTQEQFQLIRQRIMVRANLLDIAEEMEIFPAGSSLPPDAKVAEMRRRTIMSLRGGGGLANVRVAFQSDTPQQAADVANKFVTLLQQESVELRTGAASQTLEFFEQEVARLDDELAIQANKILEFKLANKNALPDSLDYQRNRQATLQARQQQIQEQITDLSKRRSAFIQLFEETGRVDVANSEKTPEQKQLGRLQAELDNALLLYSEANPRIRVLRARVAALEEVVQDQLSAGAENDNPATLFQLQLADLNNQIEVLDERSSSVQENINEIQSQIEQTPVNAIQLQELQRDYSNTQRRYNDFVARLAKAQIGELVEVQSKGQRITVIQQALPPGSPTSPDRALIAASGIGGGMMAGLALVVLLELLNTSIRRPVDITKKLGITPIATFAYVRTARENFIRRAIIFSTLGAICIALPLSVFALHTFYLPLDLLIEKGLQLTGLSDLLVQVFGGLDSNS